MMKLACLAFFLLVVSAPAVMGRLQGITEPAEMRAEVMEAVVEEVAKEELMNAYNKQKEIASTRDSYLKEVVEQRLQKGCTLIGFPCKQSSDCCFGLTCRYAPAPFYNACSLI